MCKCISIFIQLVLKLFHQTGGLRSCPKGVDTISTAAKLIDQFSLNPIPDWGEPAKEGRDSGGSLRFRPGRRACDLKLFRINYVQRVALSKRMRFEAFVCCTRQRPCVMLQPVSPPGCSSALSLPSGAWGADKFDSL